jgi:hypothetical protein
MFCPECGTVIAAGPLDIRRAKCGDGTIDEPPALLLRLWRSTLAGPCARGRREKGETSNVA